MKRSFAVALLLMTIVVSGCQKEGPQIGQVSGLITLDGEPLPSAGVRFKQKGFRPSLGVTDENGRYELKYLEDVQGAVVGEHEVVIDRIPTVEGQPVRSLPDRYNKETELKRTVEPGKNEINFELTSE